MPQRPHSRSFDVQGRGTGDGGASGAGSERRFKPLKKAWTMPYKSSESNASYFLTDYLFRCHFNSTEPPPGLLKKKLSLEGIQGTWLSNLEEEKAGFGDDCDDNRCCVVVDCFSTGSMVAHEALQRGLKCVRVNSFDNPELAALVPSNCRSDYDETFTFDCSPETSPEAALAKLMGEIEATGFEVIAVIAGAETGVELADRLSEKFSLVNSLVPTNGSEDTENRRNKFLMGEKVRSAGVRAVMQVAATTWAEIEAFLHSWDPKPYNVIVKPMESAGSDDVTLCRSESEVKAAFGNIMGKVNSLGCINAGVLVQEYLQGTEYVVDSCSLDGTHKVIALWEYDRRATNGAGFVLHGQRIMNTDEPRAEELIAYQRTVLDALNINNGPGHGEVKWSNGGPCLVEVGSRCHGAEGMWMGIASEAVGYNQVDATLDAYCDRKAFAEKYPLVYKEKKCHSRAKFLLSYIDGSFASYNESCIAEIKGMSSFRAMELFLKPGDKIKKTIDCFTWCGCVLMANADKVSIDRDYERIEEMCNTSEIYELSDAAPADLAPARRKAVVVVDPFAAGAKIAADAQARGYVIICLYSSYPETEENVSLIPTGLELHFEAVIAQSKGLDGERAALYSAEQVEALSKERYLDVEACIVGTETSSSTQLADALSRILNVDQGTASLAGGD